MKKLLVSACLLGCPCRYDGKTCQNERVLALQNDYQLIPVCPEQAGGLPTPRAPSERVEESVLMKTGEDVTAAYKKGAETALYIARTLGAGAAVLKANSPSCGKGMIYDGTFTGGKIAGNGVTAELLLHNGIAVYTEDELDALAAEN